MGFAPSTCSQQLLQGQNTVFGARISVPCIAEELLHQCGASKEVCDDNLLVSVKVATHAVAVMSDFTWTQENVKALIDANRLYPALWNAGFFYQNDKQTLPPPTPPKNDQPSKFFLGTFQNISNQKKKFFCTRIFGLGKILVTRILKVR